MKRWETVEEYQVHIRGFKSIKEAEVGLGDLTVILGPPSSGKSNFLEALSTLGYVYKATLELWMGVYDSLENMIPLSNIVRMVTCSDLLTKNGEHRAIVRAGPLTIRLECNPFNDYIIQISTYLESGEEEEELLRIEHHIPTSAEEPPIQATVPQDEHKQLYNLLILNLMLLEKMRKTQSHTRIKPRTGVLLGEPKQSPNREYLMDIIDDFLYELAESSKETPLLIPRYYGYDRMGVWLNISYNNVSSPSPTAYLSEDAGNLGRLLYARPALLEEINNILESVTGTRVSPLAIGILAYFENGREIGSSVISDSTSRLLYTLAALLSSTPGSVDVSDNRLAYQPLIMLEEPEAHVYPIAYSRMAEIVAKSIDRGSRVIVTTHSAKLAVSLWEKLASSEKIVKVYYFYRGRGQKDTRIFEVGIQEDPSRILDLEDLIVQPNYMIDTLEEEGLLKRVSPHS